MGTYCSAKTRQSCKLNSHAPAQNETAANQGFCFIIEFIFVLRRDFRGVSNILHLDAFVKIL